MKSNFLTLAFVTAISVTTISCSKSMNDMPQKNQLDEQNQVQLRKNAEAGEDRIIFTQVVQLEGNQEVPTPLAPAVETETKGIAILKVSESKKLYSKVIIQKLADGDVLRFAHIHSGAAGINGPVRLNLADSPADFGVNKELQLTDAQFMLITTGACYVNAHSNFRPAGIVRGQIR